MKKTTCLILFLLFFGITSLVGSAQTPADQNFDAQPIDNSFTNPSTDIGGVRYTGGPSSNRFVSVLNASEVSPNPVFSNRAILIGNNGAEFGGYGEFLTINNSTNFKLVSLNIETYPESGDYASEYTIIGYDNGVQRVSVDVNMLSAGTYGSGNNVITYSNLFSTGLGDKSGLLTFGSSWENIDQVRFRMKTPSSGYYWVGLDNINFEPAVLPATAPSLATNAASGISSFEVTLNGNVTSDGGASVTERGFVYSSTDNTPTIVEIGVTQVLDGSGTGIFSEAISGLNSSTTYYYQAYATNSEGTTYGGVVSFATSPTLGLEEEYLINAISLYPNPVNNVLYLSNNIKVEKIVLFDILGKTMGNIAIENNTINLSNIKTGIYLLKIETDRGSLVKRIVKD
jgi:Secretion system C-terminal sorting domain